MNNPVINYFLLRIGIFVAVLSILLVTQMDWMLAAIFAAVISFSLSIIFLRKQRDKVSEYVHNRSQARIAKAKSQPEGDVENELLDREGK
ncbi:MAG: hypothetical protein RL508_414 [Actinomycetota bacterium]|jgi:sugar phosphate permease